VETLGAAPRSVSVQRTVYGRRGRVLHRETWRTNYRGEAQVVRVGTKPKPEPVPEEKPKPKPKPKDDEQGETAKTKTETEPAGTTPTEP
jgi:hypothetical protein